MKNSLRSRRFPLFLVRAALFLLAAASQSAQAQDEPTIVKDTIRFMPFTNPCQSCPGSIWRWTPRVEFRVNGPIASGSQLYVEAMLPGSTKPWVTFDCRTEETAKGRWWETGNCGGPDLPDAKGTLATGLVEFKIRMRNELNGTNITLFTGKAKVGKVPSGLTGPYAKDFVFYADHDWNLPIGYIYLASGHGVPEGWPPRLYAVMWFRSSMGSAAISAHLFYQGKEVAKEEGCNNEDVETNQRSTYKWTRFTCEFRYVYGNRPERASKEAPIHELSKNPGEYEIKVLQKGHLARSVKFTVAEGGSFDNGIATANKLGSDRVIVPVQIIGTQDGPWDRTAWKTGAFYGNPLTGFTAIP